MGQSEVYICMLAWKRTRDWGADEQFLLIVLGKDCIAAELVSSLFAIELLKQNFAKGQQQKRVQMKNSFSFDVHGSQERLWNWEGFSALHRELLLGNHNFDLAQWYI